MNLDDKLIQKIYFKMEIFEKASEDVILLMALMSYKNEFSDYVVKLLGKDVAARYEAELQEIAVSGHVENDKLFFPLTSSLILEGVPIKDILNWIKIVETKDVYNLNKKYKIIYEDVESKKNTKELKIVTNEEEECFISECNQFFNYKENEDKTYMFGRPEFLSLLFDKIAENDEGFILIEGEPKVGKTSLVNHIKYLKKNSKMPCSFLSKKIYFMQDLRKLLEFNEKLNGLATSRIKEKFRETFKDSILIVDGNAASEEVFKICQRLYYLKPDNFFIILLTNPNSKLKEAGKNIIGTFECLKLEEINKRHERKVFDEILYMFCKEKNVEVEEEGGSREWIFRLANKHLRNFPSPYRYFKLLSIAYARLINNKIPALEDYNNILKTMKEQSELKEKIEKMINVENEKERNIEKMVKKMKKEYKFDDYQTEKLKRLIENLYKYNLKTIEADIRKIYEENNKIITKSITMQALSDLVKIPKNKLDDESEFVNIEKYLKMRISGQVNAINAIGEVVKTSKAGLVDDKRPIGTFLFLGPSGVGKTEVAKALTEFITGNEENMIRLDMSEYMEAHSVSKIIGSPPGYVGYDDEGKLTDKIREKPYSIILLDEIEKAHKRVLDIFLQVFDDGRLTDGHGNTADFSKTIIIMTSNLGGKTIIETMMKHQHQQHAASEYNKEVMSIVNEYFRPEFLNRLDRIIVFDPLNIDNIREIARRELDKLYKKISELGFYLTIHNEERLLEEVYMKGYNIKYGARPLKYFIKSNITAPISTAILKKRKEDNKNTLSLSIDDDGNINVC